MPFCPECRSEYSTGISRCPSCAKPLVDSIPDELVDASEMRLALVARFGNASEADLVSELLETNGIETVVRGEIDPLALGLGPDPTALFVLEDDFDRAEELYQAFFAGKTQPEPPQLDELP
jgi:hypothetical protein